MLQFGVLAGALVVYWFFDSSVTGLAILLVAKTAVDLVLAVLERLRAARITAAVDAGIAPEGRPAGRAAARPPRRAQAAPLSAGLPPRAAHAAHPLVRRVRSGLLPRFVRTVYD